LNSPTLEFSTGNVIVAHTYLPYFLRYNIFTLQVQSRFKTGCHCLVSPLSNSKFTLKRFPLFFTPALYFPENVLPSSKRSDIYWSDPSDLIPPLLLYIKLLFPINKQSGIDSFLDWEGLHWDFSATFTSPPISIPFSASIPMPEHPTHYWWQRFSFDLSW